MHEHMTAMRADVSYALPKNAPARMPNCAPCAPAYVCEHIITRTELFNTLAKNASACVLSCFRTLSTC